MQVMDTQCLVAGRLQCENNQNRKAFNQGAQGEGGKARVCRVNILFPDAPLGRPWRTRQAAQHSAFSPVHTLERGFQRLSPTLSLVPAGLRQLPALCPGRSPMTWLCSRCAMRF